MDRRTARALIALGALLACAPEGRDQSRPSVRFACQEGCGSYKTVFPGETPPPCCGLPMEREGQREREGAGPSTAPTPAGRD